MVLHKKLVLQRTVKCCAPTSLALHRVPPEYVLHEERAVDLECFALTHLESFDLECTCCHCSLLMPLLARIWVEGMAVALKQLAQFLHAVSYRIFGSAGFGRWHSLFRHLFFSPLAVAARSVRLSLELVTSFGSQPLIACHCTRL